MRCGLRSSAPASSRLESCRWPSPHRFPTSPRLPRTRSRRLRPTPTPTSPRRRLRLRPGAPAPTPAPAAGSQFLVNTTTAGDQFFPAVAIGADESFIVTWTSDAQDGDVSASSAGASTRPALLSEASSRSTYRRPVLSTSPQSPPTRPETSWSSGRALRRTANPTSSAGDTTRTGTRSAASSRSTPTPPAGSAWPTSP